MFQEYPKWFNGVIVHTAEEEAALALKEKPQVVEDITPATSEDLAMAAEALGIKVDKRWSDKRLAEEISKAE